MEEKQNYEMLALPPDLKQDIKVLAAQRGMTMIDFIRSLVNAEKETEPTA